MSIKKSDNGFSVILEKVGNQPLMTTKTLMRVSGAGLAEAKDLVDTAPSAVARGLDSDDAIALKKELEALGNTVSVPGMETEEAPADTNKPAAEKRTEKKSKPVSLSVSMPSNSEFDAIFGTSDLSVSDPKSE